MNLCIKRSLEYWPDVASKTTVDLHGALQWSALRLNRGRDPNTDNEQIKQSRIHFDRVDDRGCDHRNHCIYRYSEADEREALSK